jgi:hypothetical protein
VNDTRPISEQRRQPSCGPGPVPGGCGCPPRAYR